MYTICCLNELTRKYGLDETNVLTKLVISAIDGFDVINELKTFNYFEKTKLIPFQK